MLVCPVELMRSKKGWFLGEGSLLVLLLLGIPDEGPDWRFSVHDEGAT